MISIFCETESFGLVLLALIGWSARKSDPVVVIEEYDWFLFRLNGPSCSSYTLYRDCWRDCLLCLILSVLSGPGTEDLHCSFNRESGHGYSTCSDIVIEWPLTPLSLSVISGSNTEDLHCTFNHENGPGYSTCSDIVIEWPLTPLSLSVISGPDTEDPHCTFNHENGHVILDPLNSLCVINGKTITKPSSLYQGTVLTYKMDFFFIRSKLPLVFLKRILLESIPIYEKVIHTKARCDLWNSPI